MSLTALLLGMILYSFYGLDIGWYEEGFKSIKWYCKGRIVKGVFQEILQELELCQSQNTTKTFEIYRTQEKYATDELGALMKHEIETQGQIKTR